MSLLYSHLAGGTVRIFSENDKLEPIASVFDPIIIPVAYVSFCAYDNLVLFYYDCSGQHWHIFYTEPKDRFLLPIRNPNARLQFIYLFG